MTSLLYFRIALSEAALATGANFFILGIPRPDLVTFQDHAARKPQGQGGQARHGYISCSVTWSQMSVEAAGVIRALIEAAEVTGGIGSGQLFLTVPRNDASATGPNWVDVSGIAIMPEWGTPQQEPYGWVYVNVTLRLNDVTVEAEPSSVL